MTVSGGRMGRAVSNDGVLDVQLRTPKLNGVADGTNPSSSSARPGARACKAHSARWRAKKASMSLDRR
ncbi:MAG: hypothetical protein R2845_05800 [Thermomicrobiales bacterium]